MTVAVTGATGHLGANLVRALLADGREVRAITAEPVNESCRALDWLNVERVHADVCDRAAIAHAIAGCDVVYHLAARISIVDWDASDVWAVNVHGTDNVVDACVGAGVRRLVHVSSYHAISSTGRNAIHEDGNPSTDPSQSPYARSKAFGEKLVLKAVDHGLDAVIVNPTGMIGPWDFRPSMLGRFLVDIWRGRMPALVAGGVNCVDVRDVASTLMGAECNGRRGERYLVGGFWVSISELADIACAVTGQRPPRFVTPRWLARAVAPMATSLSRVAKKAPRFTEQALLALEQHRLVLDGRAQNELGHRPRTIEDTVADTHAWFADHGMIKPDRAAVTSAAS